MSTIKQGAPFFAMIGASIFGLYYYQKAKFEVVGSNKHTISDSSVKSTLDDLGLSSGKSAEKLYEEYSQSDSDNWENVRGPRSEESNIEWIEAMQKRKEEREKEIAEKRANLSHIKKILNRESEYWTNRRS